MKDHARYTYICTNAFVLLVFSFFLLFTGFHGYLFIQQSKYWCFLLLFGGYLALLFLFFAETALLGWCKLPSPVTLWKKLSFTQRMAVLYLLLSFLSTLVSPYGREAWVGMSRHEGFLTQLLYVGCFLFVSSHGRSHDRMWKVLAAAMLLFCGLSFLQFAGLNPLGLYPDDFRYGDANTRYLGIYLGTIGNADLVAALLCMVIPIFALQTLHLRPNHAWPEAAALIACLVVLFWMKVSAGFVGLTLGLLLSIPVLSPGKRIPKRLQWVAVLSILVLGLVLVYALPVKGTLYELQQLLHGNISDRFGSGRIGIWRQVLAEIPKRPIFGTGPDTMLAKDFAGASHMIDGEIVTITIDAAHNEYLNIAYHQGIPAAMVYLIFLGSLLWKWAKQPRKSSHAALLGCAVLCYCIQAFFSISMCMTAGIFWILLGLLERNFKREEERT